MRTNPGSRPSSTSALANLRFVRDSEAISIRGRTVYVLVIFLVAISTSRCTLIARASEFTEYRSISHLRTTLLELVLILDEEKSNDSMKIIFTMCGLLIGAAIAPVAIAQESLPFPPTPSASTAGLTMKDSVY
jgi:hypothetical protein